MITQKTLLEKWNTIKQRGWGYQLVDPAHPLKWHIGFSDIGKMTMLLVIQNRGPKLNSSKSIEIAQRLRPDNLWTLSFDLLRLDQKDVFALLCADIIEYSRESIDEDDGIQKVVNRYKQWDLLLERQKSPFLSESSQKGLIGELLVMKYLHEFLGLSMEAVVNAWQEPEYSDQDFRFSDTWFEVKTTGIASHSVTISSVEQLDSDIDGHLSIYRIDKCNADDPQSITLIDAVQMIKGMIYQSDTFSTFNRKLMEYGYIDAPDYGQQHYKAGKLDFYKVDDGFPRIIRSALPTAILNIVYTLDIAAIDSWRE